MINIIPSPILIPVESIKLGRFLTNVAHPDQDYHDPTYSSAPVPATSAKTQYDGISQESRDSKFSSALTSLLSVGLSKRAKSKIRIETKLVRTYTLRNSTQWFEEAVSSEATRHWFEREIDRGNDIYFIVGFHTVTDAQIIHESATANERTGQLGLPIGLALNAAGVIAPMGDLADPQLGVHRGSVKGAIEQYKTHGDYICGFQYRKVRHRWLSSRNIDNAMLANTPRWSAWDQWRDEEEGIEDILEVETVDLGKLEGDWDEAVAGSETLLLRPS